MLYRFKSQASADLLMLEPHARQVLEVIGKAVAPQGIITVDQMPAAITALEQAIDAETRNGKHNGDPHAAEAHDEESEAQHVSLRQRASPMLRMLKECLAAGKDIVWGA